MSKRQIAVLFSVLWAAFLLRPGSVQATYSIVACDPNTRACGVAVQTNNLAVGASVPYAQAGVGAVASQFETNPHYGPRGLVLLAEGLPAEEVLKRLLAEDGNFDGAGPEARQVGIVSVDGRAANYTGDEAQQAAWSGVRSGAGYSIQGNGLVGPEVAEAMERAFCHTSGLLAEKLMAALLAGDRAGGQRTGRESAALLIRTREGWPIDIDLRVDHAADPVGELRQLFDMQMARQEVVQAKILAGRGNFAEAKSTLVAAVARGATWQRVWLDAAHVALSMEEPTLALQYLAVAFDQNPNWIPAELGEGKYAELGADPQFHIWITKQQQNATAESHRLTKDATPQKRIELARRLLEIGRAANALGVLNALPQGTDESIESLLLASTALEALGKTSDAIVQCHAAAAKSPDNPLVLMRLARLERRVKAPN
jgi:uncharacterized Ntn-hydrolase superfamily protein